MLRLVWASCCCCCVSVFHGVFESCCWYQVSSICADCPHWEQDADSLWMTQLHSMDVWRELDTASEAGPRSFLWKLLSGAWSQKKSTSRYESTRIFRIVRPKEPAHLCLSLAELTTSGSDLQLTWMVIKQFNYVALLGFWNMIGPNGFNSDSEMSHFAGVVTLRKMCPLIYRRLFHNVSLWEKVFLGQCASRDVVITRFGRYVKLASKPGALPVSSSLYTSMGKLLV